MERQVVSTLLAECLDDLFDNDLLLLTNDVSERAITHKLAEYLQRRLPNLNVDCEYNRNVQIGAYARKYLLVIENARKECIGDDLVEKVPEEVLRACSTYPDIIVHRRGTNDANLLVIEAKKVNSTIGDAFDFAKLRGFTGNLDGNDYCYEHGVFIKFQTAVANPQRPRLRWFAGGLEV
jgi:hypothetical protein